MEKLTMFVMQGCPYCRNAKKAVEELRRENPAFADVELEVIDENEQAALADSYDYWSVPSVFLERRKLYEAHSGESYAECKEHLRASFEEALKVQ